MVALPVLVGIVLLHLGFFCASMGGHVAERGASPSAWDLLSLALLYASVIAFCLSVTLEGN